MSESDTNNEAASASGRSVSTDASQPGSASQPNDSARNTTEVDKPKITHPGIPKLYHPIKPFVPPLVFGFPITAEDRDNFARRYPCPEGMSFSARREYATQGLLDEIPKEYKYHLPLLHLIDFKEPACCLVLGTNMTKEDIYFTLNLTMIEEVQEIMQTRYPVGWFLPIE